MIENNKSMDFREVNHPFPSHMKKMRMSWNDRTSVKLTDGQTILKYITADAVPSIKRVHDSGLIQVLTDRKLLQPCTLKETGIDAYPMLVEIPFIPRLSYPFEWPTTSFKEVALTIIEIEEIANTFGYTLYDPNPFNAAVHEGRPLYLDHGSLVPINGSPLWSGYEKAFRDFVLFPLGLYEKKLNYVARLILHNVISNGLDVPTHQLTGPVFQRSLLEKMQIAVTHRHEISSDKMLIRWAIKCVDKLLSYRSFRSVLETISGSTQPVTSIGNSYDDRLDKEYRATKSFKARAKFLKRLRRRVKSIRVSEKHSNWSTYYQNVVGNEPPWERDVSAWTAKEKSIKAIVEKIRPKTALDIGANTGWFSLLLARLGVSVVAIDRDEESINQLFNQARNDNLTVQPLIMDVRQPTPEYELNVGTITSMKDRFKCDLVMALAVIHHMVSNQGITLEHLSSILADFSEKYVIAEFVPVNEELYSLPSLNEQNWSIPIIKKAFEEHFNFIGIWDSFPEDRKLLLFQKKTIIETDNPPQSDRGGRT